MRLVQVAKALGMTGQELRKELMQVNFGIKPTDREVPDSLAKGIVRFIAQKKGIQVDIESLGMDMGQDEEASPEEDVEQQEDDSAESSVTEETRESHETGPKIGVVGPGAGMASADGLHVLRKLSLDDVSKEAIAKQQERLHVSKTATDVARREEQAAPRKAAVESHQEQIKRKEGTVTLPDMISVKELAEKTGIQVPKLVQTLMKNGVMATITQSIDYDTAAIVMSELGVETQREQKTASAEHLQSRNLRELMKDDPEKLQPRPPVIVVMGHVDHGKTAILDAIRQTDVVSTEAGGITQHIGAYQVEHTVDGVSRKITFLDTPGHEAFTAMRARGAQVTDIVILVVSAEEGVKATTIEAINHAKEADVPIIVAINKMDKERADPDRVKGELAQYGLQPEEWGGTTSMVPCSAVSKQGISDLLDHIIFLADVREFKANPDRQAVATVIESHLDTSLGALATIIVNTGTLRVGDIIVCGETTGKVKSLTDAHGKRLVDVGPSGPARVSGFGGVPRVGEIVQAVASDREARALLEQVQEFAGGEQKRNFADLVTRLSEGKITYLKVVLKTDAQGSQGAIQDALGKLSAEDGMVNVKVIHSAVGGVSENDVMMAAASDGIVLAFHVPVPPEVLRTAEREGIEVRQYRILYELLDEVSALLTGLVQPVEQESILGHLQVRGVFLTKHSEQIIGGKVTDGAIKRVPFRLQRPSSGSGELEVVGTGRILSLKHVDKDIKEAKEGSECGMRVDTTTPVQEGDVLEAYIREFKKKEGA